jgi:formate hydrogenlyase transcriptional activator
MNDDPPRPPDQVPQSPPTARPSEQRYRLIVKLGRVVNANLDVRQVFRAAARGIRPLFRCDRLHLLLLDRVHQTCSGYALEYGDTTRWVELAIHAPTESTQWVLHHRRTRLVGLAGDRPIAEDRKLFEQGYRACVELPLLCRDQGVGVLGLAVRDATRVDGWDLELLGELCNVLAVALDNAAAYTQIAELKAQLERENRYLRDEVGARSGMAALVGDSAAMREVRQAIAQVAPTGSTVLILGETGVGKELVARAIHELSPRREQLLVKVNCAALAPGVLTSELFGHEAGAFTGATRQRIGRIELANLGSLFLDEIAEVPPEAQVLLLRALQERVIERVGGHDPISVDVRVLAATNRDLATAVRDGAFRADLFYRLNVFPLRVPPLRERREDIPALVHHFIAELRRRVNKAVTRVGDRTMELLTGYQWPGNVRELENIVERGLIVSGGDALEIDPTWLAGPAMADDRESSKGFLADQERQAILDALRRTDGRVYGPGGAAALLGVKPTTLYGKMRKHGIRKRATAE